MTNQQPNKIAKQIHSSQNGARQSSRREKLVSQKGQLGWCLYDWANSPFATLISTFVFATYFTQQVAENPLQGASDWAWAAGISGFLIAILAPLTGAIADHGGCRKCWLAAVTIGLCGVCTAMWCVTPEPSSVYLALILYIIGNVLFETGQAYYNAMLGDVAPPSHIGRLSGWGWALGYAGGLIALVVSLFLLILPETPPLGLDKSLSEPIRLTGPFVAIWLAVFCIPLFLWVRLANRPTLPIGVMLQKAMGSLWQTLTALPNQPLIGRFLLARLFYTDGLTTLFAMGGIYAAQKLGFSTTEVLIFGIAITASAGIGSAIFAFLDDLWGPKQVILIGLMILLVGSACLLLIDQPILFYGAAMVIGVCFGPIQASSRSLMTHIVPADLKTEYFGLYAMSGKATAFLGPLLVALMTEISGSLTIGMASILIFIIIGAVLLYTISLPQKQP